VPSREDTPISAAPAPRFLKLVLVDDNPADARLVHLMLQDKLPDDHHLAHFERLSEAVEAMRVSAPHLLLLDMSLPDAQGVEAVRTVLAVFPDLPIVVLTGHDDEQMATAAVRAGAQDYLVKGKVDAEGLIRAMRYAVERKLAELERSAAPMADGTPASPRFRARQVLELLRGERQADV
jgi:DNA-binding NarL/FixJ family response regulator